MDFLETPKIYFNDDLCGYYKKLWWICKEQKSIGCDEYLSELSDNIKLRPGNGSEVLKV